MNRVAVLIPVYRNQSGLDRSLASLRSQTYSCFDVVVVDDGSPDHIVAHTEVGYRRSVSVLRLERNRGVGAAKNHGLQYILAQGYSYVAMLDSSDTPLPERLGEQVLFLDSHPNCAAVSSFVDFVDSNQEFLFRHRVPCDDSNIRRAMHLYNCMVHSPAMIRASAFTETGLYREDLPMAEDYELFLRFGRRYTLANLPQALTRCEYSFNGLSIARRKQLQRERLKLQLSYFDALSPYSFFGIARSLLAMLTPHAVVYRFKRSYFS
jgi:glycosyltransferase involved in cell wall biosynthesis